MSDLVIDEDVRGLGIWHPAACLITNLHVFPTAAALDEDIAACALDEDIATCLDTVQHHPDTILNRPEVMGFQELADRMGFPRAIPAGRHRLELLQQRGFRKRYNVVDAYNLASVEFGSSVGLHDISRLGTFDVQVFRAKGGEMITPLNERHPVPVPAGSVVYGPDRTLLLAALGNKDVDSDDFKVTETTKAVLLVALGNSETSNDFNRALCYRVLKLIRRTCPEARAEFLEVGRTIPVPLSA